MLARRRSQGFDIGEAELQCAATDFPAGQQMPPAGRGGIAIREEDPACQILGDDLARFAGAKHNNSAMAMSPLVGNASVSACRPPGSVPDQQTNARGQSIRDQPGRSTIPHQGGKDVHLTVLGLAQAAILLPRTPPGALSLLGKGRLIENPGGTVAGRGPRLMVNNAQSSIHTHKKRGFSRLPRARAVLSGPLLLTGEQRRA